MVATAVEEAIHTLNIVKERFVEAPIEITFEALMEELGPESVKLGGVPMPLVLEAWPGGRWFRDTGNNTGHLWGHVQVIKPPVLLELCGPMFMSYAATNFVQYSLKAEGSGTRITLTHAAIGLIPEEHREGVQKGWAFKLERTEQIALEKAAARRGKR